MTTFMEALNAAKDTSDPEAFIARVKSSVADEIRLLDSTAKIEDTHYFNHSAIPDMVVSWPHERGERRLYLRDSYDAVVAADDAGYLDDDDPILLSLDTNPNEAASPSSSIDRQAEKSPRLLLTDPTALNEIGRRGDSASPMAELVRANFVRGAKGHIDRPRASDLLTLGGADDGSEVPTRERIRESFFEDAAARITRTAQLISMAMAAPQPGGQLVEGAELVGGKLSATELKTLLPWLLSQEAAIGNRDFWSYLGGLMSFADLESIRNDLQGLNLSPLILANSEKWSARRAYIGLAVPVEGDETYRDRSNFWSFNGGAIGIDVGEQRLLLANNGQLTKARDNTSSASWSDVGEALGQFRLARVELHGIRRSFTVTAEQSPDVRGDVEEVTRSLDDNYFVSEVSLRFPAPGAREGTTDVEVSFDKGLVVADEGASLKDLADVSLKILNFRQPPAEAGGAHAFPA